MSLSHDASRTPLAFGAFLRALSHTLDELPHEALKAFVREYAAELPVQDRTSFLDRLRAAGSDPAGGPPTAPDDSLLAQTDAFVQRLQDGVYFDGYQWDPDLNDHRAFGDESWADEMDELFSRASLAYVRHQRALSAHVYGKLLHAFELDEAFCGPEAPERMVQTDLVEAKSRFLRSLYETLPLEQRASRLIRELETLIQLGPAGLTLQDVLEADVDPLPDREAFLPLWIEALRQDLAQTEEEENPWGLNKRGLLREAVRMTRGLEGLAELARSEGDKHPGAYFDWVTELVSVGQPQEAIAAAKEGLARVERPEAQATLADRLAMLALQQGDGALALDARRQAWRLKPEAARLIALCAEGQASVEQMQQRMREERQALGSYKVRPDGRLISLMELLSGDFQTPACRLLESNILGWSAPDHPGPTVFAVLAVAGSGASSAPEQTSLESAWREIDIFGWKPIGLRTGEPAEGPNQGELVASETGLDARKVTLTALLEAMLRERALGTDERVSLLDIARSVVEKRVQTIVSEMRRHAYERAALIAVAYAEAKQLGSTAADAHNFLGSLHHTYARHSAFRHELDRLVRSSAVLSARPSKAPRRGG